MGFWSGLGKGLGIGLGAGLGFGIAGGIFGGFDRCFQGGGCQEYCGYNANQFCRMDAYMQGRYDQARLDRMQLAAMVYGRGCWA